MGHTESHTDTDDYQRIASAIRFIDDTRLDQPDLDAIAAAVGLSPWHFHRLFTRWAGISPKRFLGYLTVNHARDLLARDESVLGTALDVGLSGPSRLHDLFVSFDAMTPGEAKGGAGLSIRYSVHETPFGVCGVMTTERGVCGVEFLEGDGPDREAVRQIAEQRWPHASLAPDTTGAGAALIDRVFGNDPARGEPIRLHLGGTNFQIKVWEALLRIPPGAVSTYGRIAEFIGKPKAVRAVGTANAYNPVAFLIPCHRVIRQTGSVEGYRWGTERKRAMLAWEQGRQTATTAG